MSPKILIIYPYFSPAQKAGGIVSSLNNLVANLNNTELYIYTSAYDLDGSLLEVENNIWQSYNKYTKVYYSNNEDKQKIVTLVKDIQPTTIYINGIYGYKFFLNPLLQLNNYRSKIIIAPRGMLHAGALQVKTTKKRIYLWIIKGLRLLKNLKWHATDLQEQKDITQYFPSARCALIKDTPNTKPNYLKKNKYKDSQGNLRLVFLSLITEKKNLLFLLNILLKNKTLPITLDIIGPIKDHFYWEKCQARIQQDNRIQYKGEVAPSEVSKAFNNYDYFVFPTLGENFGHVIFESLIAGTPVITSPHSPWDQLKEFNVGNNIELNEDKWFHVIETLCTEHESDYIEKSNGCSVFSQKYLDTNNPIDEYYKLFQ
ncbi:glycosyltransferase [Flammeovirga sp. MY04]|uniref:glycosyltransferase n=1 Tax=Flammeovirga sp. MY04 TaxID=1191459 RepID=UPI0008061EE2|nr:glycosyltransferase [Flammeovirga sp. MY04]ANQ47867.1 glycosyltransferase [Flammeovirga sp. MY04]